jgi:hypothetical protein
MIMNNKVAMISKQLAVVSFKALFRDLPERARGTTWKSSVRAVDVLPEIRTGFLPSIS